MLYNGYMSMIIWRIEMIVKIIVFILILWGMFKLFDIIDLFIEEQEKEREINVTRKADEDRKRREWERRQ